jgi:membrane protein implicated in regulation of membrane protease activity
MEIAETIRNIFNVCIGVGFAVPLLSLAVGSFGSLIDFDLNFDTDADIDGPVPFNVMSLCFALILFGALGRFSMKFMVSTILTVVVVIILVIVSLICYRLFYRFVVLKLKSSNPLALEHSDLIGKIGMVTLRITEDSDGTVSVKDSTGANISYRARLSSGIDDDEDNLIPQGERVVIVDFNEEEKVCYVSQLKSMGVIR